MKKIRYLILLAMPLVLSSLPFSRPYAISFLSFFSGALLYGVDVALTPVHAIKKYYFSLTTLNQEVREIKEKNEVLLQENIALKASFNFMQRIKEIKEFCQRYELHNALVCKILVKNFGPEGHFFLINRGSRDQVEVNMIAAYKFQLLGKVVEVYPTYSKVLLITDPSSKIAVQTNIGAHQGILVGGTQNKQEAFMQYINPHVVLAENDFIFSSGQGMIFPEGFCLGSIVAVEKKDIYQVATIKPVVDLSSIEFCQLTNQEKIEAF